MPQNISAHRPVFSDGRILLAEEGNLSGLQSTRNRSPVYHSNEGSEKESNKIFRFSRTEKADNSMKAGFWKILGRTLLLVLLYYLTSIGLTFYQKWLLRVYIQHFQ